MYTELGRIASGVKKLGSQRQSWQTGKKQQQPAGQCAAGRGLNNWPQGTFQNPTITLIHSKACKKDFQSWCRADLLFFRIESTKKARRPHVDNPLRRFQSGDGLKAPIIKMNSVRRARGCAVCCRGRAGHATRETSRQQVPAGTDWSQAPSGWSPLTWADSGWQQP